VKNVLLTGGTGFVGANLALRLLQEGSSVALLVRPGCAMWRIETFADDLTLLEADLTDAKSVARAVRSVRPDWIFHLAAYGAYPQQRDLTMMQQTNVAGLLNLVDAALKQGFESFVNAGSSSEYGYKDFPPSEVEVVEPNSDYAWTKVSATQYCRYTAQSRDVYMPTLRLYSVYGPYEEPSRFVPSLIARGLRGELPPLADATVARDFVYVDDVCDAFVQVAANRGPDPGTVYNVGTGIQSTLADVVEIARRRLPIRGDPSWGSMPNRSWDAPVWVADNSKILTELNWLPRHTLDEGFGKFVDWFLANPSLAAVYDAGRAPLRVDLSSGTGS
jgi:nucleoside-diphosphate-sugar epimerase